MIQASEDEIQVAVLENDKVVELFMGNSIKEAFSGNIYLGRIENVLPGMQSAFIDIGLNKNAFLYVEEAVPFDLKQETEEVRISDCVKKGQKMIVQVIKEPVRQKGSRVTRHITIPGRYLVLMPMNNHLGISRKIEDETEAQRLRAILEEIKHPDIGIIARTNAESASADALKEDVEMLTAIWAKILAEAEKAQPPALLHSEGSVLEKMMRDVVNNQVGKIVINDQKSYEILKAFRHTSGFTFALEMIDEKELFSVYGIKNDIVAALSRKIWLDNGSYVVFDETEALASIDVNTGKFIGTSNFEDTILQTNMKAIKEIVRQIRLRNLGGIIIIDFIDMQSKEKKDLLIEALKMELKKDRVKSHIFGITTLGLVEMTRKKVGCTLSSVFERKCQNCEGRGRVTSERHVFAMIREDLKEYLKENKYKNIIVRVSAFMYNYLINHNAKIIKNMEEKMGILIVIIEEQEFPADHYVIEGVN